MVSHLPGPVAAVTRQRSSPVWSAALSQPRAHCSRLRAFSERFSYSNFGNCARFGLGDMPMCTGVTRTRRVREARPDWELASNRRHGLAASAAHITDQSNHLIDGQFVPAYAGDLPY